jgi:hypothetical protein
MRLSSLLLVLAGVGALACGAAADTTSIPPTDPPPTDPPSPGFPSAAGTWAGTLNYRSCEESAGFGYCATRPTPTATTFRATIAQSSQTHSISGLIVADVTGSMSFDGITGNFTGVIDDIGSIFFDDDAFVAPLPPDRAITLTGWLGQLYGPSWFSSFHIVVTASNGGPGQASVNVNLEDVVRVAQ